MAPAAKKYDADDASARRRFGCHEVDDFFKRRHLEHAVVLGLDGEPAQQIRKTDGNGQHRGEVKQRQKTDLGRLASHIARPNHAGQLVRCLPPDDEAGPARPWAAAVASPTSETRW